MAALVQHAEERHAPPDGRLLRYRDGRPITYRRYDGLWVRIGRHLPWVRTQQISTHWLRHTTLTWVERNFGFAVAHAYAGHTDGSGRHGQRHVDVRARHAHRGRHRPGRADRRAPPARGAGRGRSMTALADFPVAQAGPRAYRGPGSRGPGPAAVPGAVPAADRSGAVRDQAKTMRSWPLLVLAVPAAAEVWSGWVGIAQKTGFGVVPLLPGIWSSLHLDTAVTLPVGVECYAAYALRAWLATGHAISDRTRRFARWSAICSFALGMAGQVAFHLMDQDHVTRAPWGITTLVSCLPVLVLGMGTALAHMLREDAAAADRARTDAPGPATRVPPACSPARAIRGPAGPESAGPDRRRAPPAGPDQRHRPGVTAMPRLNTRHPPLALQSRTSTTPAISPASLPEQASASPGGHCAAEGSKARTRRLTPSRSGSAPS